MFKWLFKPSKEKSHGQYISLEGDQTYRNDAVGEASYQSELDIICGGKTEDGYNLLCEAVLLLEDDNPYDSQAIAVLISNRIVGYISKHEAPLIRSEMAELNMRTSRAICSAKIVGGWYRGSGDEGHYGVKLDFIRPLKLEL